MWFSEQNKDFKKVSDVHSICIYIPVLIISILQLTNIFTTLKVYFNTNKQNINICLSIYGRNMFVKHKHVYLLIRFINSAVVL